MSNIEQGISKRAYQRKQCMRREPLKNRAAFTAPAAVIFPGCCPEDICMPVADFFYEV
jgi:hypothetical protein